MHARIQFAPIALTILSWLVALREPLAAAPAADGSTANAARQIYVDPTTGDDRATGLAPQARGADAPVKTIARGIKLAQPGDTVHLAPVQFRESAVFFNRHGEPGKPITLDGHGAVLEGSDPLEPTDWQQVSPGLYRNDRLLRADLLTRDTAVIGRWFFLFGGRMNHMGRTSKGPSEPLKKPDELQPGEWTIVQSEHAFYLRIDPAKSLADYRIAAPVRSSGVVVTGDCSHLVVRNVTATHVHNDGFNIHGKCREVRYENIASIECGDDGFSAHDDCQQVIDGFVSVGNSTGICNTGHSVSDNARVWIENCLGFDFLVLDEGYKDPDPSGASRHSLADSVIISSAFSCLGVDGNKGLAGPCSLKMNNVLVRRIRQPGQFRITKNSIVTADRLTLLGANINATDAKVELRNSIVAGDPKPEILLTAGVQWRADHNRYDLRRLVLDKTSYTADKLEPYRQTSGQDRQSRWEPLTFENGRPRGIEPGIGADEIRLPSPPVLKSIDAAESKEMETVDADVVVIGATPGGLGAAIAAARQGRKVVLAEYEDHIGGIVTNGLTNADLAKKQAVAGLYYEFTRRVVKHYEQLDRGVPGTPNLKACRDGYHYEARVAEQIFQEMLAGEGERIRFRPQLELRSTIVEQDRLAAVVMADRSNPDRFVRLRAKAFVDATYEGDLAALAKVPYRTGREGRSEYGEPHAGQLYMRFGDTDPQTGSTGEPDNATEAYCFRFHVTKVAENRVPIERPKQFNRDDYHFELADIRSGKATQFKNFVQLIPMPHGKYETNSDHPHPDTGVPSESFDLAEENWDWPEASNTRRREIFDRYLNHNIGLIWLLQNDADVPTAMREDARQYGWCRDEWPANGHVPRQIYVRQGRRIEGEYVLTERDAELDEQLQRTRVQPTSIGIVEWSFDSHGCHKYDPAHPGVREGYTMIHHQPFQIPYGVIVPRRIDGLLVPVACSCSHVAYNAIRMEPVFMVLGEAAGIAAHLSIRDSIPLRRVPVEQLQRLLVERGGVTTFYEDLKFDHPAFAAMQWLGARGLNPGYRATPEAKLTRREAAERLARVLSFSGKQWTPAGDEPDAPVLASDVAAWLKQAGCSFDASESVAGTDKPLTMMQFADLLFRSLAPPAP